MVEQERTVAKAVAKKGFGAAMVAHLGQVPQASTEELAKVAGVEVKQAYSRLMFLQTQEGVVVSAGKGSAKVWSLAGSGVTLEAPVEAAPKAATEAFNRSHGWKPSLKRFAPVTPGEVPEVKATLLVEYPDHWRHSGLVYVCRAPDDKGVAQCWDMRQKMYTYVPVTAEAAERYGVKLARVSKELDLIALEND